MLHNEPEKETGTARADFWSVWPGRGAQLLGKHQLGVTVKVFGGFDDISQRRAF